MEYRKLIPYQRGAKPSQHSSASSTKATASSTPKAQVLSPLENQSTTEAAS